MILLINYDYHDVESYRLQITRYTHSLCKKSVKKISRKVREVQLGLSPTYSVEVHTVFFYSLVLPENSLSYQVG